MSFYDVIQEYNDFDFEKYFKNVTDSDVLRSLEKEKLDRYDVLNLLSEKAQNNLEIIAQRANRIANQYIGKTVCLYTPMYIANYCINECVYCSYNKDSGIKRKKLNMQEIDKESDAILKYGLKHILVLTGESEYHSSKEYIGDAIELLSKKFPSIGIEVYPMDVDGYKYIISKGAEGLTVYQETYDETLYKKVHIKGPKADFKYRLDAPERGAKAGMKTLSLGALLGLGNFRVDAFFTILHGDYLKTKYPHIELTYSAPRMKPFKGHFEDIKSVNDAQLYQVMSCMRIFDPHAGLNVSTRENLEIRKHLMKLGVSKLSACVTTEVGGHSQDEHETAQFKSEEDCSLNDIKNMLDEIGYQYVFKDWVGFSCI